MAAIIEEMRVEFIESGAEINVGCVVEHIQEDEVSAQRFFQRLVDERELVIGVKLIAVCGAGDNCKNPQGRHDRR
jgi:hypothetical protein